MFQCLISLSLICWFSINKSSLYLCFDASLCCETSIWSLVTPVLPVSAGIRSWTLVIRSSALGLHRASCVTGRIDITLLAMKGWKMRPTLHAARISIIAPQLLDLSFTKFPECVMEAVFRRVSTKLFCLICLYRKTDLQFFTGNCALTGGQTPYCLKTGLAGF